MTPLRIAAFAAAGAAFFAAHAQPVVQSGRGLMHGYVAFDDFSYNDVTQGAIQAKVELRGRGEFNHAVYTAETDRHGAYDIPSIGMGEYTLRITASGHTPYQIDLYIPSDFECRLAIMLKKAKTGAR